MLFQLLCQLYCDLLALLIELFLVYHSNFNSRHVRPIFQSCHVCLLIEQISDCLQRDAAIFITCSSIKYLQVDTVIYISYFLRSNCRDCRMVLVLATSFASQLSGISLCSRTHCRFIVKGYVSSTKRSRHLFTNFDETLGDCNDFKAATVFVYINILLVVSTLLLRVEREFCNFLPFS